VLIVFAGLLAGTLIGAVSIGGVIVLPLLIGFGNMAPEEAIQLSLAGFMATGLAAMLRGGKDLTTSIPLLLAAVPGAVMGSIGVHYLPPVVIVWLIALLAIGSTAAGMLPRRSEGGSTARLSPALGVALGIVTGAGSALTGSGGPLVLAPLLRLLHVEIRQTIRFAQAVQLPVAAAATLTHLGYVRLDVLKASLLATALVCGLLIGEAIQARAATACLVRLTNLAVILTVAAMLAGYYFGR
jgi:uncharacterized membrane protein YfcA